MKSLLFLGGMFPKDSKKIIDKSRRSIQNAANVFQWNVIEGFLQNKDMEIDFSFLSVPFLGAWPFGFSELFVKSKSLESNDLLTYVSFLNIPFVKNISRYFSCKRAVKKWIKKNSESDKYIVIYSAHTPFVAAVNKLKKNYNLAVHLIVPDLPQYMVSETQKTLLYRILKGVDIKILNNSLRGVDSYTFLTSGMNLKLNHWNKPFVVVEGMVNRFDYVKRDVSLKQKKTVLYSGGLTRSYGVKNLVDSSDYFNPDVQLVLCGAGELEDYIIKKSEINKNIVYCGQLPREKVLSLQAEATVLVNPRQNNEEYTKYSFPSKLMEYMLSGNPILCFKLDGIPQEYDDVLFYFEKDSPAEIAKRINEVCLYSDEKLLEIHNNILNFALESKNEYIQSKKILRCVFGKD